MAIDDETRATIVRLSRAEGWSVGAIAGYVGVHHSTVTRVLEQTGQPLQPRPKLIDPFIPYIKKQFEAYPDLKASTLYRKVEERGYRGGEDHFRHMLRTLELRPVKTPEPSIRMTYLAGEQAQVDWAEFGTVRIGRAVHKLMGFLMTLSYSGQGYLGLFYNARMSSFLQGHVDAFEALGGVPTNIIYDNLRSAVVTRRGRAVTFNPKMLALAAHYAFLPHAAWPRTPTEKARVERRVGFARTGFFDGRDCSVGLDALNDAARDWAFGLAARRPWSRDDSQTVSDAFVREQKVLIPLPAAPYPSDEKRPVRIDKTCFARFESNFYSVPPRHAGALLTLYASRNRVRIVDGLTEVASHERSYHRQQTVADPEHEKALMQRKRRGRAMMLRDRLLRTVPRAEEMLTLAGQHGENVSTFARQLYVLLDEHGADELDRAIAGALERTSYHPNTVRHLLEERRRTRGLPPVGITDTSSTTTPRGTTLDAYDTLNRKPKDKK